MIETIDYNLDAMKLMPVFLIILISLIVLAPSFNLALTGDDYLGLYRFETTPDNHNLLKYFLTDYGPQDLITVLIHNFVGFNSKYYYFISYILRTIAAFSFFPLVYTITKNKKVAYFSVLFFAITTTGIETVDWSFNMPSYIGIFMMNLCLYFLLKSKLFLSYIFFTLAIISQPIRLSILVFVILLFTPLYLFIQRKNASIKNFILYTLPFLAIFIFLLKIAKYGGPTSVSGNIGITALLNNFLTIARTQGLQVLLNPIGQIGNIVFPTTYIPAHFEILTQLKFLLLSITFFLAFSVVFFGLHKAFKQKIEIKSLVVFIIASVWTLLVFSIFSKTFPQVRATSDIVGFFVGGYFLIISLLILLLKWSDNKIKTLIFLSLTIIACSFIAPWIRDPSSIQSTINRYLIVSGAGLTFFVAGVYLLSKKHKLLVLPAIFILFANMFFTYKYLSHLRVVRENTATTKIRHSITSFYSDNTQVYYFESDQPEVLYHSIMFGFPVIMHYENGMTNTWNVVYTTDWKEVENAYIDGSSLKRFGIGPITPVEIDNIHSFKLWKGEIEDTSDKTRQRLIGQDF